MKRLLLMALLPCVLSLNAQQALWNQAPVVSPEINADNSVTFRLQAPEAKKVIITGDFLPAGKMKTPQGEVDIPGYAELARGDNGVWEFTSAALSPELYSYSFVVDGMRINDPSNVYRMRDVSTISDIFIIDGDNASRYMVKDVPHGNVAKVWYKGDKAGKDRRMTVYTPAGYEKGDRDYPVFYLLHGMGGDENAWQELGRAAQILDNMIAAGEVEPMIVVMTNGNMAQDAAPGEGAGASRQPTFNLPHTMDGYFETAFPDVVNYIDSNYRTRKDKHSRAIAGLSMGGFHSMQISKEYPDMFDYVGLFSAAIMPREGVDSPIYKDIDAKLKTQFDKKPALYWIGIGDKDFLYQANKEYRQKLDTNGYSYTYYESPDGPIWRNWRVYLTKFLPLLFK